MRTQAVTGRQCVRWSPALFDADAVTILWTEGEGVGIVWVCLKLDLRLALAALSHIQYVYSPYQLLGEMMMSQQPLYPSLLNRLLSGTSPAMLLPHPVYRASEFVRDHFDCDLLEMAVERYEVQPDLLLLVLEAYKCAYDAPLPTQERSPLFHVCDHTGRPGLLSSEYKALLAACKSGRVECVRQLLSAGVPSDGRKLLGRDVETALDGARQNRQHHVVKLLLQTSPQSMSDNQPAGADLQQTSEAADLQETVSPAKKLRTSYQTHSSPNALSSGMPASSSSTQRVVATKLKEALQQIKQTGKAWKDEDIRHAVGLFSGYPPMAFSYLCGKFGTPPPPDMDFSDQRHFEFLKDVRPTSLITHSHRSMRRRSTSSLLLLLYGYPSSASTDLGSLRCCLALQVQANTLLRDLESLRLLENLKRQDAQFPQLHGRELLIFACSPTGETGENARCGIVVGAFVCKHAPQQHI